MSYTSSDGNSDTPVSCHRCGYEWQYSGEMQMVTCPSCQSKTSADVETSPTD